MSLAKAAPLTCTGHSRPVTDLQFTKKLQNDKDTRLYLLVSACKDGYPMLRDGVSGDWIGTFMGHKGAVWCSRITEDGSYALTASADFTVNVWNTSTGKIIANLPHDRIVRTCDFAPGSSKDSVIDSSDGSADSEKESLLVVTASYEKKIRIWNVAKREVEMEWTMDEPVRCIVWVSRSLIITIDFNGLVQWWDVSDNSQAKQLTTQSIGSDVGQVEFINNWIIACAGTVVNIIHAVTGKIERQIDVGYKVSAASLSNDITKFVTGSSADTYVRQHDFETGKLLGTVKGHHGPVHAVQYSPDGCLVATGSEDGTIRVWKTTTGPYGLWNSN